MASSNMFEVRKVVEFYRAYAGGAIPPEYNLPLVCLASFFSLRFPRGDARFDHAKLVSDNVTSENCLVFQVATINSNRDTRHSEDPSIQLALDVLEDAERIVFLEDLSIFLRS